MIRMRTAAVGVTSLLLASGGLFAGSLPAAAQSAGDVERGCDADLLFGVYGTTDTFTHKGRTTRLLTEKAPDWHAITTAKDIAYGDAISVQRSLKPFPMGSKPKHPSTVEVLDEGGGIKACDHEVTWWEAAVKDKATTDTVWLQSSDTHSYAVRSCVHPYKEQMKCGSWYVDHK